MNKTEIQEADKKILNCIKQVLDIEHQNIAVQKVIEDVLSHQGKLLRPKLLLSVYNMGSSTDDEKALLLCAVVEILHMASLVHDDIIDDSPQRRGVPSVQSRYGKDMAVYTGDFLLSRSVMALFERGYMREGVLVTRAIEDMCNGELSQLDMKYCLNEKIENYISNVTGKTASMFRLACELGCIAGGIEGDILKNILDFAVNMGIAFQIRDDYLDLTFLLKTDGKEEGKPVFMDFQSGILTLPVLCAMESKAHRCIIGELSETARSRNLTMEEIAGLKRHIFDSGGMERCREIFDGYYIGAKKALLSVPESSSRQMLLELLEKLFNTVNISSS